MADFHCTFEARDMSFFCPGSGWDASGRPKIMFDANRHNYATWRDDQGQHSPTEVQFTTVVVAPPANAVDTSPTQLAKMGTSKDKYSVILPTYNERQNLPVLVQMLYDVFTKE
jgi:hypothetical protein